MARDWWQRPGVIIAAALLVRLLTLLPALGCVPFSDEDEYHQLATRLAAGRGYCSDQGVPTAWRPPLWPFAMSLVYRVVGPHSGAARLLQGALGTALVATLLLLAGVVAPESPRARTIVGWWAVCSPTLLYYSHSLFSETLFALLSSVAFVLLLRLRTGGPARAAWGAGVLLGLACLCRGSTIVLVPLLALWLAVERRRAALVVTLVCALTVAPWTARNWLVFGALVPVDTNGMANVYFGNHPRAPLLRAFDVADLPDRPPALGEREPDRQKYALEQTKLLLRAHPGRFLLGLGTKTGNLWGLERGLPGGVGAGLYRWRGRSAQAAATALGLLDGGLLLVLGALGLGLSPNRRAAALQWCVIGTLTFVHAVSYGHSRYRFGAVPLLIVFAALALSQRTTLRADLAALPTARRRWTVGLAVLLAVNQGYEVVVLEAARVLGWIRF